MHSREPCFKEQLQDASSFRKQNHEEPSEQRTKHQIVDAVTWVHSTVLTRNQWTSVRSQTHLTTTDGITENKSHTHKKGTPEKAVEVVEVLLHVQRT